MIMRRFLCLILLLIIFAGCATLSAGDTQQVIPENQQMTIETVAEVQPTVIPTTEVQISTVTQAMASTDLPEAVPTEAIAYQEINPEQWKNLPILPQISPAAMEIYQDGILKGRDARSFSVFGDCQSLQEVYMGVYDTDPVAIPDDPMLQETVEWFSGSFSRNSPTLKKGTTVAAILWEGWIDEGNEDCDYGESPLACEIRLHNPSIVLINLGTHWEVRNELYLRKIIEELINLGIVPVISTKADTREGDAYINAEIAQVAADYQIPLFNFWAAAQQLENYGMKPNDTTYLNDQGIEAHRLTSLQTLDTVWRALNSGD